MFFDTIRNAFKNIFFKKLRSMLTISAVAIGSAAIVIIGNISQYSSNLLEDALDSMGMGGFTIAVNSGSDNTSHLSTKDLQTVKDAGYIEEASPVLVYDSKVLLRNTEEETLLWGVDENADQIVSMEILYGRPLSQYDVKTGNMVCLIDEAIAKAEYGRGNIIGKEITVNCMGIQLTVEVVGIVETGGGLLQNLIGNYVPSFIYIPITTLQTIVQRDDFDRIAVKAVESEDTDVAGEKISQLLDYKNQTNDGYIITNLSNQRDQLIGILDIVTIVLIAIGAVSLLVSGLGIMNVMLVSVNERTKEIGIKKSIGAQRKKILQEFFTEAFMITTIGGIIGIVFGVLVTFLATSILQLPFYQDLGTLVGTLIISILIGGVFGVYPAAKAAKLSPVIALREG